MLDFETFEKYWKETTDAIYYRINSAEGIMLSRDGAEKLWNDEINKRFFSQDIIHGATTFLNDLKERRPNAGRKTEVLLRTSPSLGTDNENIIKSGATAAAGAAGVLLSFTGDNMPKPIRVLGALAGAALAIAGTAKTAKSVNSNVPSNLAADVADISRERLQQFRDILESTEE